MPSGSLLVLVKVHTSRVQLEEKSAVGGWFGVGQSTGNDAELDPLFYATIDATEEAIVNALLAAETTTGKDGRVAHRLDPDALVDVMRRYGR